MSLTKKRPHPQPSTLETSQKKAKYMDTQTTNKTHQCGDHHEPHPQSITKLTF